MDEGKPYQYSLLTLDSPSDNSFRPPAVEFTALNITVSFMPAVFLSTESAAIGARYLILWNRFRSKYKSTFPDASTTNSAAIRPPAKGT
jgi:hypothetical protein